MLDFLLVSTRTTKQGIIEIYPTFRVIRSKDLMIRGGDFYAVWLEKESRWSTDEQDAIDTIDHELDIFKEQKFSALEGGVRVLHLWDGDTLMIDKWHKFCKNQCRDSFVMLDERLIFANTVTKKEDYASKKLKYALEKGDISAYDKLMSTLYSEEERHKIEWAIGSIVTGDSKTIQKFMVLYGAMGTGKSTVIHIIEQLFEGYISVFDAKTLGSSSNAFALEAFTSNPLVAIQHDGDLSHIEDNTRINSLVSHEYMTVNEKFKSAYSNRFKAFLFMGTNKPVKITDARSGLIRRLIDVQPSGNVLPKKEYDICVGQIKFELGAIAWHCREVYLSDPAAYDSYIPTNMLGASNDFYNFVLDSYYIFSKEDGVSQKIAWDMYKAYCEDAKVTYPLSLMKFKEELKNYFREFLERYTDKDGNRIRSYYKGFRKDKFETSSKEEPKEPEKWLIFNSTVSLFDDIFGDCPAQYADADGKPLKKWEKVTTVLNDISTSEQHYVRIPDSYVIVDFDIPDAEGKKDIQKNIEAALKFPPTYAELSRSGGGIHLIYIYDGDTSKLDSVYADHIEIKVCRGLQALRRRLSLCNDIPISHISSGLPLKGAKMVDFEGIKNEKMLRSLIVKNLRKEIMPNTAPSINLIFQDLEKAYASGIKYDVTDMMPALISFAASSSNQANDCLKKVGAMKLRSDGIDISEKPPESNEKPLVFFDCEVFPNLFLVNYKIQGANMPVARLINPSPADVERLLEYRLVGFNCRRYDNHMLYACLLGYSVERLFDLSQRIISGDKNAFFGEAYNLSYTDVYDFSSEKKSLKKFEIELGIHHQELGLPWDKPVPEERWQEVAEYCDNDVLATEAVFNARYADFTARKILADVAGMTVNDTTNSLTTRIIFGSDRKPQSKFNYRNMGDLSVPHDDWTITEDLIFHKGYDEYTVFDNLGRPLFPGYKYESGVSTYRDEEVGEGGYVYAEPGIYYDVALLDIASMHPSTIIAENLFGDEYTKNFRDIRDARVAIKHKDFDRAKTMLGGKLAKYLDDTGAASDLAKALKIAINSVYGLTAAKFDNAFRDIRNVDNIVAKRGALFMVNLKHEVQKRGFTVAHIKTDSIKIPDATPEIISFVMEYGKMYGYSFEHEATYEKMCLVNDAEYIAKYKDGDWTATGKKFAVPYLFKQLFSHEEITFSDKCETKSSKTPMYLDLNENLPEGEHELIFVGKVGLFCPIRPGCGGGILVCERKDKDGNTKYDAVTGTKGYRWLEAETVKASGREEIIDISYYEKLVSDAREIISKYGDIDIFLSDFPPDEELPF